MYRLLFLLAVYSGLRAVYNRFRCLRLRAPLASAIDGETIRLRNHEPCRIRVHARKNRMPGTADASGMISVAVCNPGISKLVYGFYLGTSHFGFGHIEIAFFERDGVTVLFAVRNIIRSNVERFGGKTPKGLKLLNERDELSAVRAVVHELELRGLGVVFAEPETCVAMAVSPNLISPNRREAAIKALTKKYRRINKALGNV